MRSYGIPSEDRKVILAQVYGMCDHLTYTLGKPRATLCVFSHAKIETTGSKGVHCSVSDA